MIIAGIFAATKLRANHNHRILGDAEGAFERSKVLQRKQLVVVFGVRWGGVLRTLLDGGVISRLIEMGASVAIFTTTQSYDVFKADPRLAGVRVVLLSNKAARVAVVLERLRGFLFRTLLQTETSKALTEQIRQTHPFQYLVLRLLGRRLQFALFAAWRFAHRLFLTDRSNDGLLKSLQPDLVVVPSMGRGPESYQLLRSARRLGIKTLCAVSSWDVLTTHEYPLEHPEKVIVWNQPNKEQACRLYGYHEEEVYITGSPYFDFYSNPAKFPPKIDHFRCMGLDEEKDLILVTGQAGIPRDDVRSGLLALSALVRDDRLRRKCQVLFRPHPMVYYDKAPGYGTEEDLSVFENLGDQFHVNRPKRAEHGLDINIDSSDVMILAASLLHCSVMIDFFGTVSVEACLLDKPVIYLGIGSSTGEIGNLPLRRRSSFTHVRLLLDSGAGRLVDSAGLLKLAIDAYLENPSLDRSGRSVAAKNVAFILDGRAGWRMAKAIHGYALGTWPSENEQYSE